MTKESLFTARVEWTGNTGEGNRRYLGYQRTWSITTPGKPVVNCSNDPALGGDPSLHNPEDLLLTTIASCHMLWYLHLASNAGVHVLAYQDTPEGMGETESNGAGRFLSVTLRPEIVVAEGTDLEKAHTLHEDVGTYCFIARSMNFPIHHAPTFREGLKSGKPVS